MRLKLVPPNCSFLESIISSQKPIERKPSYVYPNSLLKLSPKSLELCTESLGSETGSDTSQCSMLLFPKSNSSYTRTQEKLVRKDLVPKTESKKVVSRGFPPPLTTISSLNLLHIRSQHEGGRLIIQAVAAPPMKCCFRAERSHGRLRLTYWKSRDHHQKLLELKNDKTTHVTETDNNAEEDERIHDELETEKQIFEWPSRCKEDEQDDKGMRRNWEPFWLTTS
ncbi:protein FANTASTIC FOUR 3-like [Cynara cardunculus var. scolymus]|uniref:protein FANTASTIC FOUR 3-like n=1 Tax=Cynara cardunculus var. scolymus TaxID=59895 RepID=UPI000D62ADC8|nr:protein FANTASTIC FOUR 3-like [Cynara cardunculus var. scolymus]